MARLKLWLRNLIISLVLLVSVVGVGVGLSFLFRPSNKPQTEPQRELTPQQKQFISVVQNNPQEEAQTDIVENIVTDDGEEIELSNIVGQFGNYLVVKNAISLKPEFYSILTMPTSQTTSATTLTATDEVLQIVIKKIELASDIVYTEIMKPDLSMENSYAIYGDYAIVQDNNSHKTMINLATGKKVMDIDDQTYLFFELSRLHEIVTYEKAFWGGDFWLTQSVELIGEPTDEEIMSGDFEYTAHHTLYNLADMTTSMTFGKDDPNGEIVDISFEEDYVQVVSTKYTFIISNTLSEEGEFVYLIDPIANTSMIAETEEETIFEIENSYSAVTYHTVQFLPNEHYLLEEKTMLKEEGDDTSSFDVVFYDHINNAKLENQILVGINYSAIDQKTGEVNDAFAPNCYVSVEDSSIEGYIFVKEYHSNVYNDSSNMCAAYYDYDFNLMVKYLYSAVGEITYQVGDYFVSYGSSKVINVWGEWTNIILGNEVFSRNVYNNVVVLQSSSTKQFTFFNFETNKQIGVYFDYATQIMNGKSVVYTNDASFTKGAGFYLATIDQDGNISFEPIYNFDVTADTLSVVSGSVGYYVEKDSDTNLYTFVTTSGQTYSRVASYETKRVGEKLFTSLVFSAGEKATIVSKVMDDFVEYSDESVKNFKVDWKDEPEVQTTRLFTNAQYAYASEVSASNMSYICDKDTEYIHSSFGNVIYPDSEQSVYNLNLFERFGFTYDEDTGKDYGEGSKTIDNGVSYAYYVCIGTDGYYYYKDKYSNLYSKLDAKISEKLPTYYKAKRGTGIYPASTTNYKGDDGLGRYVNEQLYFTKGVMMICPYAFIIMAQYSCLYKNAYYHVVKIYVGTVDGCYINNKNTNIGIGSFIDGNYEQSSYYNFFRHKDDRYTSQDVLKNTSNGYSLLTEHLYKTNTGIDGVTEGSIAEGFGGDMVKYSSKVGVYDVYVGNSGSGEVMWINTGYSGVESTYVNFSFDIHPYYTTINRYYNKQKINSTSAGKTLTYDNLFQFYNYIPNISNNDSGKATNRNAVAFGYLDKYYDCKTYSATYSGNDHSVTKSKGGTYYQVSSTAKDGSSADKFYGSWITNFRGDDYTYFQYDDSFVPYSHTAEDSGNYWENMGKTVCTGEGKDEEDSTIYYYNGGTNYNPPTYHYVQSLCTDIDDDYAGRNMDWEDIGFLGIGAQRRSAETSSISLSITLERLYPGLFYINVPNANATSPSNLSVQYRYTKIVFSHDKATAEYGFDEYGKRYSDFSFLKTYEGENYVKGYNLKGWALTPYYEFVGTGDDYDIYEYGKKWLDWDSDLGQNENYLVLDNNTHMWRNSSSWYYLSYYNEYYHWATTSSLRGYQLVPVFQKETVNVTVYHVENYSENDDLTRYKMNTKYGETILAYPGDKLSDILSDKLSELSSYSNDSNYGYKWVGWTIIQEGGSESHVKGNDFPTDYVFWGNNWKNVNIYAEFEAKQFVLSVAYPSGALYEDGNTGDTTKAKAWTKTVTYHTNVNLPILHAENGGVFYQIGVGLNNNGSGDYTDCSFEANRKCYFTYNNLIDTDGQRNILKGASNSIINLAVRATAMQYAVGFSGSQNVHVYSNADNDAVLEKQVVVTASRTDANNSSEENPYTPMTQDTNNINHAWADTESGNKFDWTSGQTYVLKFENFNYGMILDLALTYQKNNSAVTTKYRLRYESTDDNLPVIKKITRVGVIDVEQDVISSNEDFEIKLTEKTVVQLTPKYGLWTTISNQGSFGSKQDTQKQSPITIVAIVSTQDYGNVELYKNEETTEEIKSNITLSDIIAGWGTKLVGHSSTMILPVGKSNVAQLYTRYFVVNEYISGVKIDYGTTIFDYNIAGQDHIDIYGDYIDILGKLFTLGGENGKAYDAANFENNSFSIKQWNRSGAANIVDKAGNNIVAAAQSETTFKTMFDVNAVTDNVYYFVMPMTDGARTVYLIFAVSGSYQATALLFDIEEAYVAENTYKVTTTTEKYEGTLTVSFEGEENKATASLNKAYERDQIDKYNNQDTGNVPKPEFAVDAETGKLTQKLENVHPSNYFEYTFVAEKGYYFDEFVINYNGTEYIVKFDSFVINADKNVLTAQYKITNGAKNGQVFGSENTRIEDLHLLDIQINAITPNYVEDGTNKQVVTLVIGGIQSLTDASNATVVAKYLPYSIFAVTSVSEIRYQVEDKNIIIYDTSNSGYNMSTIALTDSKAVYASGYSTAGYVNLNGGTPATKQGDTYTIFFFVKDYIADGTTVSSWFDNSTSYRIEANNNIGTFENNLSKWSTAISQEDNKSNREATIVALESGDSAYSNILTAYKVDKKEMNLKIESNIDYINFDIDEGSQLKQDERIYNKGGENGQVASTGTVIGYSHGNSSSASNDDYIPEMEIEYYGKLTSYKVATIYGYEFVNYEVLGKTKGSATGENAKFDTTAIDGNVKLFENGVYCGIIQYTGGQTGTITITLGNINTNINLKLYYKAKTFDVTYDANYAFGSTDVMFGETSVNAAPESRRFIYNIKSNIATGTANSEDGKTFVANNGKTSVDNYTRVGYFLSGWAFGSQNFVRWTSISDANNQNFAGKTYSMSLTTPLATDYQNERVVGANIYCNSLESVVADGYQTMLYERDIDAGYAWYLSLAETQANVFGHDNNVTMYAIWCAKTYELVLDYNDATNSLGSTTANKFTAHWVFDHELVVNNINNEVSFISSLTKLGINTLSTTYRIGYTFDGWYLIEGTFNGADGWNEENKIFSQTTTYNTLSSIIVESNKILNNDVYERAGKSWKEENNKINLFAKWVANKYRIVYDLNDVNASSADGNTYDKLNGGALNNNAGVGSSVAKLGTTVAEEVEFDTDQIKNVVNNNAFRYGYKFLGWYATREVVDSAFDALIENQTLDLSLYMYLFTNTIKSREIGGIGEVAYAESDALLKKMCKLYEIDNHGSQIKETLVNASASNSIVNNAQTVSTDNIILVHARWQVLDYKINIDLNNWNHTDYAWDDADYLIGGVESVVDGNKVDTNKLYFVVTFDTQFGTGRLFYNGQEVLDEDDIQISINNKEFTLSGTAYEKLVQLVYSQGYNLGLEEYDFAIAGTGYGFEVGNFATNANTKFDESYLYSAIYLYEKLTKNYVSEQKLLSTIDYSGQNKGDRHDNEETSRSYDVDNVTYFGRRTFTLFALWTAKKLDIVNDIDNSDTEIYANHINKTIQNLYVNAYIEKTGTGEQFQTNNYASLYTNFNAEKVNTDTTLYYIAPRGQYAQTLSIEMKDSNGVVLGTLSISFAWNSNTRRISIVDVAVNYESAALNAQNKTISSDLMSNGTFGEEGYYEYSYNSLITYLCQAIEITTSKYYVTTETKKYWDNTLKDNNYREYSFATYCSTIGNGNYSVVEAEMANNSEQDVNIIIIKLKDLKSYINVYADNKAQTYTVDYYRYIRPVNNSSTRIVEDSELKNYGEEYWDSEFYNSWDQYKVYNTLTYKYGEYISTTYGYAANFGFDGWYYYQGHIHNAEEYANYVAADVEDWYLTYNHNQEIDESYSLFDAIGTWEAVVYDWSDEVSRYVDQTNPNNMLPYESKIDGKGSITLHKYSYNQNYLQYRFDSNPITGNMSLIGLYVPSSLHKIHYFVLENGQYVERIISSNEYVLGTKRVASVSGDGLEQNYGYIEYFELGTNTDYYYVGFADIARFDALGKPTEQAALAFLLQFINSENYLNYQESFKNNHLSISWADLKNIIKAGITFNDIEITGIEGETPKEIAEDLERKLINIYSDVNGYKRANNRDYLSDYDIIKNLSIYASNQEFATAINDAKNAYDDKIIDLNKILENYYNGRDDETKTIGQVLSEEEIQALSKYYTLSQEELTSKIATMIGIINTITNGFKQAYYDDCLAAIYKAYGISVSAETFGTTDTIMTVINAMSLEDLSEIVDEIAKDYFGYVLKNPSSGIGNWVDGTYFAGWYKVDSTLQEQLVGREKLLTYNSNTWNNTSYACYQIMDTRVDEFGNITYILEDGYEVTRFRTINYLTGEVDTFSRVDNDIFVFAAFNCFKFEFSTNEDGKIDVYENDIQWGRIHIPDVNGDPYQYKLSDVRYVALTADQYSAYLNYIELNNNKPTSLRWALDRNTGNIKESLEKAKAVRNVEYILAIVYNVTGIDTIVDQYGNISYKPRYNTDYTSEYINSVSTNCLKLADGSWKIISE